MGTLGAKTSQWGPAYFSNLFMKLKLFRGLCSYNLLKYKSGGSHYSKCIAIIYM